MLKVSIFFSGVWYRDIQRWLYHIKRIDLVLIFFTQSHSQWGSLASQAMSCPASKVAETLQAEQQPLSLAVNLMKKLVFKLLNRNCWAESSIQSNWCGSTISTRLTRSKISAISAIARNLDFCKTNNYIT